MNPEKSIPLSLVSFAGIVLVVASLAGTAELDEVGSTPAAEFPPDVALSLAGFDEAQRGLEAALQRATLSTLDQPPEARRDALAAWMQDNRTLLEAQVERANTLDRLFAQHGINPTPDERAAVEAQQPASASEMATAKGRHWELQRSLAELRHRHGDDPEALRDALQLWHESSHEALLAAEVELREEFRQELAETDADPAPVEAVSLVLSSDAPPDMQRLFELQNALADAIDADPSPLVIRHDASFAEMDAWRQRVSQTLDPLTLELNALNQKMSDSTSRQLATEARRENAP